MTMHHAEAIGSSAAERYALGEMGTPERDRYEEHFFDCPDCAEEVKAAVTFLDSAAPVLREEKAPASPGETGRPDPEPWWAGLRALFWPLPYGAAAAAALLIGVAGYQSLVVVPDLRTELREADGLQSAPWYFLSVSRSEPPAVAVSEGQRRFGLTLSRSSEQSFPFYLCELRDAGGRTVLSSVVPAPPQQGELQLLLPGDELEPGAYHVAVAGLESASSRTPASELTRYHFTFERAGRPGATR